MRYRAEIDGLRAVAILPVVLFHAGLSAFSGGFVGVDIFFVISGYLITTILKDELQAGHLNLLSFYERRARRILPALFVVMALSSIMAWHTFSLEDIQAYSQSLVAVPLFLSNILFWTQSGYFETGVDLKPLLHTWSLSVEEQYYIIFPGVMLCLWRWGRVGLIASLAVAALISLAVAQWGVIHKPNAAFYFLPTRAWEILLGSLAALTSHYVIAKTTPFLKDALSLLGLALIVAAIFMLDATTPFPGVAALLPTLGAVLILLYGTSNTLVGKLLSLRGFVYVGMVSYSFYLWHQPVFAFARYDHEPALITMLLLVVLSFGLGIASWNFIENPFRRQGAMSRRAFASLFIVAGALFVGLGIWGSSQKGYEAVWYASQSPEVQQLHDVINRSSVPNSQDDGACRFNSSELNAATKKRLLDCHLRFGSGYAVLGDSHAIDLFGAISTSDSVHPFIFGLTSPGCRPHTPGPECRYDELSNLVKEHRELFVGVVFEQAGFYLLRSDSKKGSRKLISDLSMGQPVTGLYPDIELISADLDYLKGLARYTQVLWFGPRVEPHIKKSVMSSGTCHSGFSLRPNQFNTFETLDMAIAAEAGKAGIDYLSQIKSFKFDFAHDLLNCDGLYWDDGDHFSAAGERRFGQRFDVIGYMSQRWVPKP